jgi:6-phosphogluconolactonase
MLPTGFTGSKFSADVQIHPSGKFVYGSNRGDDTIAVFAVDAGSGKLIPVERVKSHGKTPRIFAIDPTGQFLIVANEGSSSLVVFRIDQKSGRLTATGEQAVAPKPTCIKFVRVQPE